MNDKVIIVNNGIIPHVYDYVRDSETEEQALSRVSAELIKDIAEYAEDAQNCPRMAEYWKERQAKTQKELDTIKIMTYPEFWKVERDALLSEPPQEITEDKFNEMLDILPPLHYISRKGFTMFCMSEMYTGTYTTQYAYHKASGKYYSLMVDVTDPTTWIYNRM